MPDTFGKRQRQGVKNRKAAAREERRLARAERRENRAAGIEPEDAWLGQPENVTEDQEPPEETEEDTE